MAKSHLSAALLGCLALGLLTPDANAIGLLLFNPVDDAHHAASISGQCIQQDIQIPCRNIEIVLADVNGNAISRLQPDSHGAFAFPAQKGVKYRIKIESDRFESAEGETQPLFRGDHTTLFVVPKKERLPASAK